MVRPLRATKLMAANAISAHIDCLIEANSHCNPGLFIWCVPRSGSRGAVFFHPVPSV
jgi:hypothetical protein